MSQGRDELQRRLDTEKAYGDQLIRTQQAEEDAIRAEIRFRLETEERVRIEMRRQIEAEMRQASGPATVTTGGVPGVVQGSGANNQQVVIHNIINQIGPPARASLSPVVRLIYFLLFGWYVGFAWVFFALLLCVTIVGLPIGILMLTRTSQAFFLW